MAKDNVASSDDAPEDNLRGDLEAAFAKVSEAEAPEEEAVETPDEKAERERDEATGRFKAKAKEEEEPEPEKPAKEKPEKKVKEAPEDTEKPKEADFVPPPGWSPTAKAAFKELPPAVQEAVAKREQEINKGFEVLKNYKQLDPYIEMANKAGTDLPDALQKYVAAEQLLERDPISGLKWLCQNYNIDPRQLMPAQQAGQEGAQQPAIQQPAAVDPRQYLAPVMQRLAQIEQAVVGEQQAKVGSEIDAFFNDVTNHPYAENVADQMAVLLRPTLDNQGRVLAPAQANTLAEAYDTACYMNPEVRGLLIKQQRDKDVADQKAKAKATANQARVAGQSITGGPASTPTPDNPFENDLRGQLEHLMSGRATV